MDLVSTVPSPLSCCLLSVHEFAVPSQMLTPLLQWINHAVRRTRCSENVPPKAVEWRGFINYQGARVPRVPGAPATQQIFVNTIQRASWAQRCQISTPGRPGALLVAIQCAAIAPKHFATSCGCGGGAPADPACRRPCHLAQPQHMLAPLVTKMVFTSLLGKARAGALTR